MTKITVLDRARHGALRLDPTPDLSGLRYALLGLSELAVACADFPICMAKDAQTGRFNLITLFSLEEPRNLFWIAGKWQATYLPVAATTVPFLLDVGAELGLAIDEDNPRLGREGIPLWEADGRPSGLVSEARARLQRLTSDVADAQLMVDRFAELRLIRPLTVVLERKNGTEHQIEGLYSLGSRALAELSDDVVVNLYRLGYIAAASLMRASLNQMERLRQLHSLSRAEPPVNLRVQVMED
ncbi:MAG: SapC family protein [Steroidobacteraceae bacterium]